MHAFTRGIILSRRTGTRVIHHKEYGGEGAQASSSRLCVNATSCRTPQGGGLDSCRRTLTTRSAPSVASSDTSTGQRSSLSIVVVRFVSGTSLRRIRRSMSRSRSTSVRRGARSSPWRRSSNWKSRTTAQRGSCCVAASRPTPSRCRAANDDLLHPPSPPPRHEGESADPGEHARAVPDGGEEHGRRRGVLRVTCGDGAPCSFSIVARECRTGGRDFE
jgi:hypothetical protein